MCCCNDCMCWMDLYRGSLVALDCTMIFACMTASAFLIKEMFKKK